MDITIPKNISLTQELFQHKYDYHVRLSNLIILYIYKHVACNIRKEELVHIHFPYTNIKYDV